MNLIKKIINNKLLYTLFISGENLKIYKITKSTIHLINYENHIDNKYFAKIKTNNLFYSNGYSELLFGIDLKIKHKLLRK